MSYAINFYFLKLPRIDEIFGVNQQFGAKSELKTKIADFSYSTKYTVGSSVVAKQSWL
jgi:hypothetical protein